MVKVVQCGLGGIGLGVVELLLSKPWVQLVGAVDVDKNKIGRDVGELLPNQRKTGIAVSGRLSEVLDSTTPDVVTHATSSHLKDIHADIIDIVDRGTSVVSTAEELAYPFVRDPEVAREIDEHAQKRQVVVLGTGVNPGFILDTLAVILSGVCQKVNSIRGERIVDASARRISLKKKIGLGLSPQEFENKVKDGTVKHVGLPESIGLVALGMGWRLGEIQERITPIIAEKDLNVGSVSIPRGSVLGLRQMAKGILGGQELVVLDLQIYVGARNPHDWVLIDGVPIVDVTLKGGVHGDMATPAILVNALPKIKLLEPGLRTMLDVPPLPPFRDTPSRDRSVMLKTL